MAKIHPETAFLVQATAIHIAKLFGHYFLTTLLLSSGISTHYSMCR